MASQLRFRCISYTKELVDGKPLYVSSNCVPVKAASLEPAGHTFHSVALKLLGFFKEEVAEADDQKVSSDKGQSYMASSDSYSSKGKKKSGTENQQDDHYALLGLGHLRFLATEDQIRKSYRETALKHHPDKQAALLLTEKSERAKQAKKEEIENNFKAIQEAYEVLIDPVKRRVYDSTDEFDDEIPTDCAPQDFFKVFGSAFMRNGRWSVTQPIPSLGEESTSLEEVDSFYNFWYSFKSWREFPHADDFDLEQAESRDHKRWMERQNAKLREKARKEEYVRVRSLVDNAYKRDPRILRRKEDEKAEKKRRKEAKYMVKKLQEEEAAKTIEEERRRKEEDERVAAEAALKRKKVKEKEKKLLRKERSRLRTLSAPLLVKLLLGLKEDDVESLCMSLDIDQLRSLCDKIEQKEGIERAESIKQAMGGNFDFNWVRKDEKDIPNHTGVSNHSETADADGVKKDEKDIPNHTGISNHSETADANGVKKDEKDIPRISNHSETADANGVKKDEKDIPNHTGISNHSETADANGVKKDEKGSETAHANGGATSLQTKSENVFSTYEKKERPWNREEIELLRKGMLKYPKGTSRRWEVISEFIGTGRSVEEILKATKTVLLQKPDSAKAFESFLEKKKPSPTIASPLTTRQETEGTATPEASSPKKVDSKPPSSSSVAADQNPESAPVANGVSDQDAWSAVQERALVQALKTFPKEASQRWERVAASVPGKTVNQCKKKFASMKESFRNSKSAD